MVRGVIVQGGDPTGTGRGGESVYGGKFEDEITRNLKHTGAGVLVSSLESACDENYFNFYFVYHLIQCKLDTSQSMANSGE